MVNYQLFLQELVISLVVGFAIIIPAIYFLGLKRNDKKVKKKSYLINVIIRSDSDHLVKLNNPALNFTLKIWGKSYKVNKDSLYLKRKNRLTKLFDRIRKGIDGEFLIIFWEKSENAIKLVSTENDPVMINTLRTSRIVGKALKEQFARTVGERKGLIMLIVIILIVVLALTKFLGYW